MPIAAQRKNKEYFFPLFEILLIDVLLGSGVIYIASSINWLSITEKDFKFETVVSEVNVFNPTNDNNNCFILHTENSFCMSAETDFVFSSSNIISVIKNI